MKTMNPKWLVGLLCLAAAASLAPTSAQTLMVGDPAPKLQTGQWIQGEPVTNLEKGKAYLIEFWATWCVPCRQSIPHLNDIQARYKDRNLIVIGQDCSESNEKKVAPFVKKMGAKMTYRVALDDMEGSKYGKMTDTWQTAAKRYTIPSAYLVNTNGVIAWIGHPLELSDKVIEEVLDGSFDMPTAARNYAEELKSGPSHKTIHERGWIGGDYELVTSKLFITEAAWPAFPEALRHKYQNAVLVADLTSNTPAALAGLHTGDLILELNHQPVKKLRSFHQTIDGMEPGTPLPLTAWRDGQKVEYSVGVGREKFTKSWNLHLLKIPWEPMKLWPTPGFSLIALGFWPTPPLRTELGTERNAFLQKYATGTFHPTNIGWYAWLATIQIATYETILSQETVPVKSASLVQ